jgi:hypothetical protein
VDTLDALDVFSSNFAKFPPYGEFLEIISIPSNRASALEVSEPARLALHTHWVRRLGWSRPRRVAPAR